MPKRLGYYRPRTTPRRAAFETTADRRQAKLFYCSRPWRDFRLGILSDRPLCERCEALGLVELATEVHHKVKRRLDPTRALDPANVEALCKPCHSAETGKGH